MNIIKNTKRLFLKALFQFVVIFISINPLDAGQDKDLILVLDTSLSMVGQKGKNIFDQVKKSLSVYINQLSDDDSITFITFDTEIKLYPTVYIEDKKNKESLLEYIDTVQAKGKWTYTKKMVQAVLQKAQELENKDKSRQRVIVIMTDALDDPPPDKINDRLNIKEVAYKDKDWFVFFINFGKVDENSKLAKLQKQINTNVTAYTKIIQAKDVSGNEPGKVIEQKLGENIDQMTEVKEERTGKNVSNIIIALLVIGVVLILIFFIKGLAGVKVQGKLEYWDHTLLRPYIATFDLAKFHAKEIFIGKKGTHLILKDFTVIEPISIVATKSKNAIIHKIISGKNTVEFINKDADGYIQNGDMFRVANYTFKFII